MYANKRVHFFVRENASIRMIMKSNCWFHYFKFPSWFLFLFIGWYFAKFTYLLELCIRVGCLNVSKINSFKLPNSSCLLKLMSSTLQQDASPTSKLLSSTYSTVRDALRASCNNDLLHHCTVQSFSCFISMYRTQNSSKDIDPSVFNMFT